MCCRMSSPSLVLTAQGCLLALGKSGLIICLHAVGQAGLISPLRGILMLYRLVMPRNGSMILLAACLLMANYMAVVRLI